MENNTRSKFKLWFDRLLSKSLFKQLLFLAVLLVIAFGISYLMLWLTKEDWESFCNRDNIQIKSYWLLPLYLLIDSNALNNLYIGNGVTGWMLFASSITFIIGAFLFNGAIVSIMTNFIEQRVRKHREGHIHYLKSGHHIIMGYDEMVASIISHIFEEDNEAYVLLMSSTDAELIRERLRRSFDENQLQHIIINYGHRMSKDYYKDIHLEAAEQVFIVGMRTLPAHDAINVECVDSICTYLEQPEITSRPKQITCVFENIDTYAAFKTSEIFKRVGDLGIAFIPYNFFSGWAKHVFVKRFHREPDCPEGIIHYPTVYGNGITPDDNKYVHLVFVGTTNFAVAFAMEAAQVLHFPNADKAKTRITFIETNADKEKDEFITRNRHFFEVQSYYYHDLTKSGDASEKDKPRSEYLKFKGTDANFLDVEFEFIKGDVFSKQVQDEIDLWAKEHNRKQYLSIFLASSDQRLNFVMGMNMPDAIYENAIPLFIRQDRSDNFVTNLRNADRKGENDKLTYSTVNPDGTLEQEKCDARYANIYPFGMNETAYNADRISFNRAKLINYLYETADYDTCKFRSEEELDAIPAGKIWNDAEKYWQKLSVALKWSNLYNADTIRTKLTSLRAMRKLDVNDTSHDCQPLSDYEVEQMALVEHNRWNVEKLLMGYRKPQNEEDKYAHPEYAGKLAKNKKLFIHHDIRPFDELDIVKELDREFTRYIPWILKMTENEQPK